MFPETHSDRSGALSEQFTTQAESRQMSPETDDDELWRSIQKSPLASIYLSELYWLAQDIVNRTEHLFSEAPTPVDGKLSATESESDR